MNNYQKKVALPYLGCFVLLLFLIPSNQPSAQTTGKDEPITHITHSMLEAKVEATEVSTTLDQPTKDKLIEHYQRTISFLETADSSNDAAAAYTKSITEAPVKREVLVKKLKQVAQEASLIQAKIDAAAHTESEAQALLFQEKANLAAVTAKLADLVQQLLSQADRPEIARQKLIDARLLQQSIANQQKQTPSIDQSSEMTEAKQWLLSGHALAIRAEIKRLDQELLSQPMRVKLVEAQRDDATARVKAITANVRRLEDYTNQLRSSEAEAIKSRTEEAEQEAQHKAAVVLALAQKNAQLSELLSQLAAQLDQVSAGDDLANNKRSQIEENFRNSRKKLEIAGLSETLGQVLLDQRQSLPDEQQFRKQAAIRKQQIAENGLRQIQHHEEQRRLRDHDRYMTQLLAGLSAEEHYKIQDDLERLLVEREKLLEKMIAVDAAYLSALGDLDYAQRRLFDVVSKYDTFLAERLLWIRSAPPLHFSSFTNIPQQIAQIFSWTHWLEVVQALRGQASRLPVFWLVLLLFTLSIWQGPALRRLLQSIGKKVGKPTTDSFSYTFQAIILTLLLSLRWPLLSAFIGWQLQRAIETTEFSRIIGDGLIWIALPTFYYRAFRNLCAVGGLAEAHFRWPDRTLRQLRSAIDRLMILFLPTLFFTAVILELHAMDSTAGLGRLALCVTLLALAIFFYRLLRQDEGVLCGFMNRNPNGALVRYRRLWLILTVSSPIALIGLTLYGYVYTAGVLTDSLIDTLWFLLGLLIIQQLAVRWLLLTRGRLAVKAALERQAAADQAEQQEGYGESTAERLDEAFEEPAIDLLSLSVESLKLLNSALVVAGIIGFWMIWSEVLPAFAILHDVTLWYQSGVVNGTETQLPVTLADGLLALLIALLTTVIARRLPALMEFILLQRFKLESGDRYTITTIVNYIIVAIGIILFFNRLGVNWSQIQWLVAAFSVGIGFGMQEIIANFISGLILLIERPIRVGDTVTIGDTDGVVTRIRIRATTIRNWDRKELLVPNKEFITGRLLNWSLTDQITRIIIPVGIAYGSDVQRAMALMLEVAEENPLLLKEPAPYTTFESFGDNALALTLRVYVGSIDQRLSLQTALHEAINQKFEAAGISISFPQRDLHIDTVKPIEIRIQS